MKSGAFETKIENRSPGRFTKPGQSSYMARVVRDLEIGSPTFKSRLSWLRTHFSIKQGLIVDQIGADRKLQPQKDTPNQQFYGWKGRK